VQERLKHSYARYWKKVRSREDILKQDIKEIEDSKEDLWENSYSSSTDTDDDEDDSETEAFDIVEEAIEEVKAADGITSIKYLLNSNERYVYKYTYDKMKRPMLIIQDRKQWKKRSFS